MRKSQRCLFCGKKALKGSRYCSKKCENKVENVLTEEFKRTKCVVCGKSFSYRTKKAKLCSIECRNIYARKKKKMTYYDIFERDGFRCQYCGRTPADGIKLVVDHIYPISKGGKSDFFNLTTACDICNGHKSDRIISLKTVVAYFERSKGKFAYQEAVEYWENIDKCRLRNKDGEVI